MNKIIVIFLCLIFIGCSAEPKKNKVNVIPTIQSIQSSQFNEFQRIDNRKLSNYELAYNKALELWGCDFTELNVPTSFGDAQVIEAGCENEEVVVLLHGMNASSTMWYPNVKELAKKYRVYAIDFLMEPGKSKQNVKIESTEAIMRWYTEILDTLGLDKFNLVGASRGGWLGVNLALKHPDRIESLVLLSPAQTFKWIPMGKDLFANLAYTIKPKRKKLRNSLKSMSSNVDNIEQDYIDHYFISTKKAKISKVFIEMVPFEEEQLKSLKMPVLVLIGDDDFINNEKSLVKAKRTIKNVEAEVIKKAGHFLSFDQASIVNKKMLQFLKG